ncbi:cilia- and flagella-associated protein 58-like isoform X2 [Limulus polyphemus]|uniref:Cilia- and flagella-associated protein 58-like isoform X2 n=1 Tax=Limulus polyphemus TaxID=6850 RepID=A0ABM1TFV0_LIMPO|nr:cilia- and flagella-associated protein 58-like isoform X2 [Limulus polyphemus]
MGGGSEMIPTADKVGEPVDDDAFQAMEQEFQKELEKAWKLVDGAREKEQRGRETIQMLKVEISNLTKLAEKGSILQKPDKNVTELLHMKEKLVQEKDKLLVEVVQLRKQATELSQNYSTLEKERNEKELKVQELQQNLQLVNTEIQKEQRRKERGERDLRQAKEEIEAKEAEKKSLEQQVINGKEALSKLENQVKELKQSQDTAKTELEDLNIKLEKMHLEHQIQQKTNEQLASENNQKSVLIKNKEEEINYLKQEVTRLTKQKEAAKKN